MPTPPPTQSTSPIPHQLNPTLKIRIVQTTTLLSPANKTLLRTLSRLINDSFSYHGHPNDAGENKPGALFTRKRLVTDEEFPERLGPQALTAICIDESLHTEDGNDPSRTGKYGDIVATGSICPFRGRTVDLERSAREALAAQQASEVITTNGTNGITNNEISKTQFSEASTSLANATSRQLDLSTHSNWEIKLCSSLESPKYRGKGLMISCVDALVARLREQQQQQRQQATAPDSDGEHDRPLANLPIKLWITSLEGTGNTEYWLRRGFEMVGEVDVAPEGTWTSTREIRISTLSKVVG